MNFKLPLRSCAALAAALAFIEISPHAVRAATINYLTTGTSSWNTSGNWSAGLPTSADTAVFNGTLNASAETITLDANQSALGIQLTTGEGAVTLSSGTGTNTLTLGTGGISANGTGTGAVILNANVALGGNQTWNVNALTLGNTLSGTGNLTINTTGDVTLNLSTALGSVTGSATINGQSGHQLGSVNGNFLNTFSGGVTVNGTYYLTVTGGAFTDTHNLTIGSVFNNILNFTPGGNGTFSASVIGTGSGSGATLNQFGSGNLTFTGTTDNTGLSFNSYTSSTTILSKTSSASVHAVGGNLTLGTNSTVQLAGTGGDQIINSGTVTMGTGSTLDLNGTSESINILSQSSGTSAVTNTSASTTSTLTVGANNGSGTYSGVIQNGAGGTGIVALTKTGSGIATLTGANTYTGATTINGGTTTVTNTSSLGSNSAVTLAGGATLAFTNPGTTITLPTSAAAWQSSSDWRNTPSNLGNSGNYQVGANGGGVGGGSAAANYAQPDFILINLGANYSLSQLSATLANTFQTMQVLTANSSVGAFSTLYNANSHSAGSPSTLNLGLFTADSATFGTGTSDYSAGAQTFSLSGVSGQYLVIYVTKRVANGYGLDLSSLTLSQAGGVVSQSIGSLASSDATTKVTLDGNLTLSTGGDNTSTSFAGVISGAGGFTKVGSGTQTLTGVNTYTGATTISAGTLTINDGSIANSSGITNNAALVYNLNSNASTYSNVISGTGTLTKSGTNTLTLSGANTYTGATSIAGGTLALGASGSIANSATVNLGTAGSQGTLDVTSKSSFAFGAGQTVAGYGTINIGAGKTVTINGNLAPGNSPGILTVTGNLALATGSTTTLELAGNGGVAGTDYDKVVVSGQITFGGTLNIVSYNAYNINEAATYQLFSFGSQTGNYDSVSVASTALTNNSGVWTGTASGFDYAFSQISGNLAISASAIPEPSMFGALAGGLALAGTWLVRRRTSAVPAKV